MRHKCAFKKLNRNSAHRRALLRNMATSLFLKERCETTFAKAKAVQPVVEGLIRTARANTLHARRTVHQFVLDKGAVKKLFGEIVPRFAKRSGGFTRVIRTRVRAGDAAPMALIEILADAQSATKRKAGAKKRTRGAAKNEEAAATSKAAATDSGAPETAAS